MKIETYLDAMVAARDWREFLIENSSDYRRKERQYAAFRARILQMFEERDADIKFLVEFKVYQEKRIAELESICNYYEDGAKSK